MVVLAYNASLGSCFKKQTRRRKITQQDIAGHWVDIQENTLQIFKSDPDTSQHPVQPQGLFLPYHAATHRTLYCTPPLHRGLWYCRHTELSHASVGFDVNRHYPTLNYISNFLFLETKLNQQITAFPQTNILYLNNCILTQLNFNY